MTELDKALEVFREDMEDPQRQSNYYDLFLNSAFYIPTYKPEDVPEGAEEAVAQGHQVPLIMESDGDDYLLLFDTEERLYAWAEKKVSYAQIPGHVIAEMSEPPLYWALNVGTDFSKQFVPDEIAWLKDVVQRCNEAAEQESPEEDCNS